MMIKQKILAVFFLLIGSVLLIGSTHAWFTDSTRLEQQLPMGKLEVDVTCYNPTVTDLEPGSTNMELSSNLGETETVAQPIEGVIKNTGSIRAICRLKKEILFKFKYHNDSDQKNGIAIPNDEQLLFLMTRELFLYSFKETQVGRRKLGNGISIQAVSNFFWFWILDQKFQSICFM